MLFPLQQKISTNIISIINMQLLPPLNKLPKKLQQLFVLLLQQLLSINNPSLIINIVIVLYTFYYKFVNFFRIKNILHKKAFEILKKCVE